MGFALQDLRFLHMANQLEEMFEGLEKAFHRHLPEGAVKQALAPVFAEGPNHRRLREAYDRLNRQASTAQVASIELLEAMLACEEVAHQFYQDNAKNLRDPELAAIFKGLAAEESHHASCVREALRLQRLVG